MLSSWARRSEDLTFDKTDEKDTVLAEADLYPGQSVIRVCFDG